MAIEIYDVQTKVGKVKRAHCSYCGHDWQIKPSILKLGRTPSQCPKCHNMSDWRRRTYKRR